MAIDLDPAGRGVDHPAAFAAYLQLASRESRRMVRSFSIALASLISVTVLPAASFGQRAADRAVVPATAVAPTPLAVGAPQPAQLVRFGKRPVQVGDLATQQVAVGLDLESRFTQSGQIANESKTKMRRDQSRRIEVLAVDGERIARARIAFDRSRSQSPENAKPDEVVVQPVEGKSYLVHLDDAEMKITDEAGGVPPLEEYKLVSDVAENVGKPNPLAKLLLERPVAVGQRILVPREVAGALLGLRDQMGMVKRFELTLERLEPTPVLGTRLSSDPPSDLAVFGAKIETLPNAKTPMELTLTGRVKIEVDTCRSVAAEFAGPVQMSTIERTRGDIFQFSAAGQLTIKIESLYDRVAAPQVAGRSLTTSTLR